MRCLVPTCAVGLRNACLGALLVWVTPPETACAADSFACGSSEGFDIALGELTGRAPGPRPEVTLTEREDGLFRLQVELVPEPRVLTDSNCEVLFRSALLVVALAAREAGTEPPPPSEARAEPQPPNATQPNEPPVPERSESVTQKAPAAATERSASPAHLPQGLEYALGLRAGLALGLLPGVTASVGLAAHLKKGRLGTRFYARYLAPRQDENAAREAVRVDAAGVGLALGYDLAANLTLSLGLEALAVRGRGLGNLTQKRGERRLVWGPRADVTWTLYRGRVLALEAQLGVLYLTDTVRFLVGGGGELHETSHIAGESLLSCVFQIP